MSEEGGEKQQDGQEHGGGDQPADLAVRMQIVQDGTARYRRARSDAVQERAQHVHNSFKNWKIQ